MSWVPPGARVAVQTNYTATGQEGLIAATSLNGPITVTLAPSTSVRPGSMVLVIDETGLASASAAITVIAQGSDVIAGAFSASITSAYGVVCLESNQAGQWTTTQGAGSTTTISGPAISGQALVPVNNAIYPFRVSDRRLKLGMRVVCSPVNANALASGLRHEVVLTGVFAGMFAGLALVGTLDGRPAPSHLSRQPMTLNYIGA